MKSKCEAKAKEARRLMGISGIDVYEVRNSPNPKEWFFDIVWRGKSRWAIVQPWETEKHVLPEIGRQLRNRAAQDEAIERELTRSEREKKAKELDSADTLDVMTKDVVRTVEDKPLYFY